MFLDVKFMDSRRVLINLNSYILMIRNVKFTEPVLELVAINANSPTLTFKLFETNPDCLSIIDSFFDVITNFISHDCTILSITIKDNSNFSINKAKGNEKTEKLLEYYKKNAEQYLYEVEPLENENSCKTPPPPNDPPPLRVISETFLQKENKPTKK